MRALPFHYRDVAAQPGTLLQQDIAWRIFTKGIDRSSAQAQIVCTGDDGLVLHALSMLSIVA